MSWLQILFYLVVLVLLAKPLGTFMARVYEGELPALVRWLAPLERAIYRFCGLRADEEQGWKAYAGAMLAFNLLGLLVVYALQRLQGILPLNPANLAAVSPDSPFNTAVSCATNTNWQGHSGEATLSQLTQVL